MNAQIDASAFGGAPLTKKFAMFNSGLVPMARYRRDMHHMDPVAPRSLRIDLFMGQPELAFGRVVQGSAENPVYDFGALDELAVMLNEHGVAPYWSWCYMPLPVQENGNFRSGPTSLKAYARILEELSAHYRESGIRLGYQEVYNEPDCEDVFFTGSYDDYIRLYEAGAPAVRRGNPDAVVGGPSTAFVYPDARQKENLTKFLERVKEHALPLDFFSYHTYGWAGQVYARRTELVRELLEKDPSFKTVELHMNELNTAPAPWQYESESGRLLGSRRMLPYVLDAVQCLAEYTDLTSVSWAQWLDSGVDALGIVDVNGRPRPAFAAFEVFQRMPVRRLQAENHSDAQMMASADENRVSILMWHKEVLKADVQLDLHGLPFDEGEVSVYLLDEAYFAGEHDTLTPEYTVPLNAEQMQDFRVSLEKDDVLYIEINRAGAREQQHMEHTYVRARYYFENRASNTVSWVDEREKTVYLGMGSQGTGLAACAMELDAGTDQLHVDVASLDIRSDEGCLALRLDFARENGYRKAVTYVSGREDNLPVMPFDGAAQAEILPWQGDSLTVDLAAAAPDGWNGRFMVSFLLKDAGQNSWAELKIW